jgi:hypothetical protein
MIRKVYKKIRGSSFGKLLINTSFLQMLLNKIIRYYQYRSFVLNNIIPRLAEIGIFSPLDKGKGNKIFVPYIETSFKKIFVLVLIFKALQLRGAEIIFLICDKGIPLCESFTIRTPSGGCKNCNIINEKFIPKLGFNVLRLSEIISESERSKFSEIAELILKEKLETYRYHGIDIIPIVKDSLTRYNYGASNKSPKITKKSIESCLITFEAAHKINYTHQPDIVLSHMNAYSEFLPYNLYFRKHTDAAVYVIKGSAWNSESFNLNIGDLYQSEERYERYVSYHNGTKLADYEQKSLDEYLKKRFNGINDEFNIYSYFDDTDNSPKIDSLKIDKEKKNIFLFSNVEWDVGLSDCNILFASVMDWIAYTINAVKGNNNIHLYIKTHPNEVFGVKSELSVADKILRMFEVLPKNVTIVKPEQKISPYSLFPYIDLGIVYYGTLGLEMTLQGIPVVATAKSPYSRKGFVYEPRDTENYIDIILSYKNKLDIDKSNLNMFAYFYFIKTNIPIKIFSPYYGVGSSDIDFHIDTIEQLELGKDRYLDHLCDCILSNKVIESWED